MKLNKEEKDLLKSVEDGEWNKILNFNKEAKRYQEAARETLKKNKRVNIRMTERDLVQIQKKAIDENLPYQTLISSVLHKYINGHFIEKNPE